MTEEDIKCPICGTRNKPDTEICDMCKTRLSKKADGTVKVTSPKVRAKTHVMIDIEDPLTRKKLEELTLIPGVTRRKALFLYQSGIHSIEDFVMKAFQGERFSVNYSRTVANKLLVQSMNSKKKSKGAEILCPSCNAPNSIASKRCKVCNFDIEADMKSVNINDITGKLNDSVKGVLDELSGSDDFASLPDELKSQFAALIESDDVDFDMEKPKELDYLGIDLTSEDAALGEQPSKEEATPEDKAAVPEAGVTSQGETEEEVPEEQPTEKIESAPAKIADKEDKIRKVLTEKLVKWRKAGYDVKPLEPLLGDVEAFKVKAKEVLGDGKTVKLRYLKQLEMWREKGFDVTELEPILESDVDLFQEKAKELLKKQRK